ncbi:MAG TPA: NADH oxidase [Flavobacteriales bacterium]|nr:NADH oxidase [Flavobacteriales bacterium]|tara:strand:- start:550 stop:846 length:297 start_codon:yes stop_codon:yes gene_type:complete
MKYITVSELKEKLNQSEPKVEVIDIREEYEYEDDNCGWKNIPMAQILPRVNEIPKDKEVVFVCISGKKASAIVSTLERKFKLDNLSVLEGGYTEYSQS